MDSSWNQTPAAKFIAVERVTPEMKLVDSFGRVHTSLRLSVTDRCNIRCFYCMPEHVQFLPRREILTFEEITRVVRVAADLGVEKLRITGGEPLVRKDLHRLIGELNRIDLIKEIALTTNGTLLAEQAEKLRAAGLHRLNVSLDSLDEKLYQEVTRRSGVEKVIQGIRSAQQAGFDNIRINAVSMKGLTEKTAIPLAQFCLENNLHLRFIEFMPLDGDANWQNQSVLSGKQLRELLEEKFGLLNPVSRENLSQPATDFELADGRRIGFINSVTEPFCQNCDRLRLTAEGKLRNCLFSTEEFDVRELLRQNADDSEIMTKLSECVAAKKEGHGINSSEFARPDRAMYQIGG